MIWELHNNVESTVFSKSSSPLEMRTSKGGLSGALRRQQPSPAWSWLTTRPPCTLMMIMMMLIVMTWSSLLSGPPRGNKTYELLTENWYKWLKIFLLILYFPHVSPIFFPLDILYQIISSCRFYLFISLPGRGEMTLISAGRVADKQVLHISFPQRSQSISPSCVFPLKTNPPFLCPPYCPPVHLRLRTASRFSLTTNTVLTIYSPQADYGPPP